MNMKNPTPQAVQSEFQAAIEFNNGIELYDAVETNENFFIGRQWEGIQANGLPTPVFNFLKRVVLFSVANVSTDNLKLRARPLTDVAISTSGGEMVEQGLETLTDVLNAQFEAIFEQNCLGKLIRQFTRNAAVDGDGCTYTYWDADMETGQDAKGGIRTEILQNTQVHFGNPNDREVQSQPYIIISRRRLVDDVKREAEAHGAGEMDVESITADQKQTGNVNMDTLGGNKVTVLLKLWKDRETGTIWGYECTSQAEIRKPWDLGIKLYPITWMPWDYVQDCYHGQAMITGLIPNQIFVNKLFAMSMISLMTLAYPKVIYDRTKVAKWSNRVGSAIAVGGPVDNVAKIMDPATISPQISQFIELAISYTQKFLGASDIALGDTRPDNATAIIALQRAAATPMELTKQDLLQSVEDLGRIYMEFMGEYYGTRTVMTPGAEGMGDIPVELDFNILQEIKFGVKLDAGASSYWSEIASMQTLDNLLLQGKISTVEYLKRLPKGQITDRESLIAALENPMMGGQAQWPTSDTPVSGAGLDPVRGGPGDSAMTRAIRKTGEMPRMEG